MRFHETVLVTLIPLLHFTAAAILAGVLYPTPRRSPLARSTLKRNR
jgi:hypothetical protein